MPLRCALRAALAAATLGGCGSSGAGPRLRSVPPGYATYQGSGFTVGYPQGWTVTPVIGAGDGALRNEITPPGAQAGLASIHTEKTRNRTWASTSASPSCSRSRRPPVWSGTPTTACPT